MSTNAVATTKPLLSWRLRYFEIILAMSQIFGFAMIILSAYFFNSMQYGMTWAKKGNFQNFHGFFMLVGLVFFQGEAILSYRLYRYDAKIISKFIHVVFHFLTIGFFATALATAILQKNLDGNKNFTSAHSWIGIAAMCLYLLQFFFGFINFLLPGVRDDLKRRFLPLHRVVGCISFLVCCIQAVIGHTQYALFADMSGVFGCSFSLTCVSKLDYIFNFSLISIILYCITVLLVVVPSTWQRKKTPDEIK